MINDRIRYLAELGNQLSTSAELNRVIERASGKNPWFSETFVRQSLNAIIADMLNEQKLNEWLSLYPVKPVNRTIGLIFAGNVPLVGLHDFLCCYLTGCSMKIKQSSKDDDLFPFVLQTLTSIDPSLNGQVEITEQLKNFQAVIATGSDNTNRYFEYYFRHHPHILRKNRNSVAILTGEETENDLVKLADDIFLYFGFGCRNVSKLYLPLGYDIAKLFPAFEKNYKWLHEHNKYMSNYDYNRTLLMLNKTPHLANEFVMITENKSISSSIGCLNYEYWHDERVLKTQLHIQADKIQCVVAAEPHRWVGSPVVCFGEAQHPQLNDYADGKDTIAFLLSLN